MFEVIERLRQKPQGTKKRFAFIVSFFFAGLILVVWFSIIFPNFREDKQREKEISQMQESPVEGFGATASMGFEKISEQFNELKIFLSSFSKDMEHYSATTTNNGSVEPQNTEENY